MLLGAGASVPAGLPLSRELTELVSKGMSERSRAPDTWGFVREMLNLASDDVEQIYRSLDDLRRVLGESPWHTLLHAPAFLTADKVAEVQFDILDWTSTILRTRSVAADVEYLRPLVRARLAGIATLNFDALVEQAAQNFGPEISTGADSWDGGFHWPLPNDRNPLLKLHGSLNWRIGMREVTPIPISTLTTLSTEEENRIGGGGIFSDLRFGTENKLTNAGPMRALLEAFITVLERSDLLVVVGYSFRDLHVDVLLDYWAAHASHRRIIIVDPFLDPDDMDRLENIGSAWFGHMIRGLRPDTWPYGPARVSVLGEDAKTAFGTLFDG